MLRELPQQRNTEITQGLAGVISHVALRGCPKKGVSEACFFFFAFRHKERILHIHVMTAPAPNNKHRNLGTYGV